MRSRAIWIGLGLLLAFEARAEDAETHARMDALERQNQELMLHNQDMAQRLEDLEARDRERTQNDNAKANEFGNLTEWAKRIRLSGSANTGYYYGGHQTPFDDVNFQVWDLRLFLDADLGRPITVGNTEIARNAGFTFEWNAVRLGQLQGTTYPPGPVGETYIELQGLGGSRWFNAQVGRFQIPVGEAYKYYSKGVPDNPFITNTVGGPWWWDEGVRMYGSEDEGRFGYVASISDGETDFATDGSHDPQFTLKVWGRPTSWFYASVSGLYQGQVGSQKDGVEAAGGLWLGETWANPVGSLTPWIPTFQDGVATSGAPSIQLDSTALAAADLIFTSETFGRLWLGYGYYTMNAHDSSAFDRNLSYWIAEWTLQGSAISPELAPFYIGLRANGLGTNDDGKGYVLAVNQAWTLGYNVTALDVYSFVFGWHMTKWTTLRAEFSRQQMTVVDGAPRWIRDQARDADYFGLELGAAF